MVRSTVKIHPETKHRLAIWAKLNRVTEVQMATELVEEGLDLAGAPKFKALEKLERKGDA